MLSDVRERSAGELAWEAAHLRFSVRLLYVSCGSGASVGSIADCFTFAKVEPRTLRFSFVDSSLQLASILDDMTTGRSARKRPVRVAIVGTG